MSTLSIIDKKYNKYQKLVATYPSDHELRHKFMKYSFLKNSQSGGSKKQEDSREPSRELIGKIQNLIEKSKSTDNQEEGVSTRIKGYRKMSGGNGLSDDTKQQIALIEQATSEKINASTEKIIGKQEGVNKKMLNAIKLLITAHKAAAEQLDKARGVDSSGNEDLKKNIAQLTLAVDKAGKAIKQYEDSHSKLADQINKYETSYEQYKKENEEIFSNLAGR
jgi:hypothetical protein